MPCSDGGVPYRNDDHLENDRLKKRLDTTTELLCSTMKALQGLGMSMTVIDRVPGLAAWWKNHQQEDRRREAAEAAAAARELEADTQKLRDAVRVIRELEKKHGSGFISA